MSGPSFLTISLGVVGGFLFASTGFDWDTDGDDESPFADEADAPDADGPAPEEADNPFSSPDDRHTDDASPPDSETTPPGSSTLRAAADARALCDEAMDHLHNGAPDRAFDRLEAHWAFSEDEMTELLREVERTRAVVADRYGDALDHRLVREDTVDEVLARFVYLERFELHGLRWRFTFYRGSQGWSLNDVYFDDEIEAVLEP
jgi:hypothetical protein